MAKRMISDASRRAVSMAVPLALLILCAALEGCSTEFIFGVDERVVALKSGIAAPMPFSIGVVPCRLAFEPDQVNRNAKRRFCVPPDLKALDRDLLAAIEDTGAFKSAVALDAAGERADSAMNAAWERELDLLLEIEIEGWDTVYTGTNFWFIPNLLIWFQFWIPSWIVPDEDYALEIAAKVAIRSVHTGRTVMERRVKASYEESFSNIGRGMQLLGIFRSPDSLGKDNWEGISESLAAGAVHEFKVGVASLLAGDFLKESGSTEFAKLMRKRLGLVMGTSNYGHHRLPKALFAREDAESFGAFLASGSGARMPARNVKTLLGESATSFNFNSGIEDFLLRRARPGDELIVFCAGLGALTAGEDAGGGAPPRLLILPYDASPDALGATAVDVEALVARLDSCQARAVLVLDVSFLESGGNRSFEMSGGPAIRDAAEPEIRAVKTSLIRASSPGQDCGFIESQAHGLFSYFLVRGLEGRADADDDGDITLHEAFVYAKKETEIQAFVEDGRQQMPVLSGPAVHDLVLKSRNAAEKAQD